MAKSTIYKLAELDTVEEKKKQIFDDLGDLSDIELLDDDLLIATYVESEVLSQVKGPDGQIVKLYGTQNKTQEARYQGKAYLVVAMGPTCFRFHNNGQPYEGRTVKVGDWVVANPSDGREIFLKNPKSTTSGDYVACRRIHWSNILMRVKDPRRVY